MNTEKCECENCECTPENNCGCIEETENFSCQEQTCDCEGCGCQTETPESKIQQLEEELLRVKADSVNYRKRLDEEQLRLYKFKNEDIIKQLLPNLDNFERAINMDDENLEDEVSKFLSGFKMIYCNLTTILKDNGVVEIDGNNKPFDTSYHEAILTEKREDLEPGMVIEVLQKGYILKDKVIRPAMVKVSE